MLTLLTWTCFSGERCIPRASCLIACYPSVCKHFTNGPISPKLGTNIIWWRGFKYDEKAKIHWRFKILLQYYGANFNQIWNKASLNEPIFSNEGPCSSLRGISGEKVHTCTCTFDLITCKRKLFSRDSIKPFSTKLGTNHSWVKGIQISLYERSHPFSIGHNSNF